MWIKHDGKLYNLANVVSICKQYDTQIILDIGDDNRNIYFDNVSIRDEYYQSIERLVFNLGSSTDD